MQGLQNVTAKLQNSVMQSKMRMRMTAIVNLAKGRIDFTNHESSDIECNVEVRGCPLLCCV
jgi:hypothetical protein